MKIFVESPVNVFYDGEAEQRLASTNDSRFDTERGVLTVDAQRWKAAQKYERDTWLVYNLEAHSDRNDEHTAGFGGYAALPDELGDVIELGSGPFTNTLHILGSHKATSVTLLDPLVEDYEREHPNCTYKGWMLDGLPVEHFASGAEKVKTKRQFDTLIMVNTLPHCQNALAVFATIRRILKPKGYLVFHECGRIAAPLDLYDVGHPISPVQAVIDEFLSEFEPIYHNGNYFIGWRK